MNALLRPLRPLLRLAQIAWFNWARRELQQRDPTHPDLPLIVRRLRDLEAERATRS